MITRTVKYTNVVFVVLGEDLSVTKVEKTIPGKHDTKSAEKYFKKNSIEYAKILSVESADVLTAMDEETWLKYAKPVTERYVKVADR